MKYLLSFIFLLALTLAETDAYSQSAQEDSLTALIFSTSDPHKKIELLNELSAYYEISNPEKAYPLGLQALEIAETPKDLAIANNLMGNVFLWQEKFDSAMYFFQITYEIADENDDSLHLSKAANNMGVVYFNIGDYDEGLESITLSATIDYMRRDFEGAMISFMNLGSIYYQLGMYNESKEKYIQALDLVNKVGTDDDRANIYGNMGAAEFKLGNEEVGKAWYEKAINIYEKKENYIDVSRLYRNLGYYYRTSGNNMTAEIYYLKALDYAEEVFSPSSFKDVFHGLALNNEAMGKDGRALEYFKLYMDWADTVRVKENESAVLALQEQFNTEQTEKENEILTQDNRIKNLENRQSQAKLNQSRIVVGSVTVGLLLLLGLAVVLFNRNRLKQRANAELHVANAIIQEKNDDITASIEYASKIQEALLPTKENVKLFSDSFFMLMPKDIVSGDFLWYSQLDNKVIFAAADCTGHGVPGAFMSMIGNTYLHQIVNERKVSQPSLILDELRANVIKALSQQEGEDARKDGMDISICVLNKDTNELEFAGANNPLYYVNEGVIKELKGDKQPVGYMPERTGQFTNHKIQLAKGDAVYIFSDGYADQFGGPKGKKFKYKQMRELLHKNFSNSMAEQKSAMVTAFNEWKGDLEQIDDVCLIGIRI